MKKYIFILSILIIELNSCFSVKAIERVIQPDEQLKAEEVHTSEPSPSGEWAINIDCNKKWFCSAYAHTGNKKVWLIKPNNPFPRIPNVTWLSNEIAEIYFSCGTNCGGAMYFSTVRGVSPVFEQNLATDIKRNLIITLEPSDKRGTPAFFIRSIFGKKGSVIAIIKRNIEISFFREGVDASFNPDGTITIYYIDRKTKKDRVETIAKPFH